MFKFTIEAQTLPEMRQKLKDILAMHESAQYVVQEVAVELPTPKPAKTIKASKPKQAISVEDLQKHCALVAAKVGMPAVKAIISSFGVGSIKDLNDEQREALTVKLEYHHE